MSEYRKTALTKIRKAINDNLPAGFEETMSYGMISYVVPHSIYPDGYHCDRKQPLQFMAVASQKNFIAFHHMGIYGDPKLLEWFVSEYPKHSKFKLDMGKGCIRFKKADDLPLELIGELVSKVSVADWISCYENVFRKAR